MSFYHRLILSYVLELHVAIQIVFVLRQRISLNMAFPSIENVLVHAYNGIYQTITDSLVIMYCSTAANHVRNYTRIYVPYKKRAENTSDDQKKARLQPSSRYPVSKLSPSSQKIRHSKTVYEKRQLFAKVNIESYDYNLNDKQHNELLQIVKEIQKKGSKSIQELIQKGEQAIRSDGNILKEAWQQDVIEHIEFEKDQRQASNFLLKLILYYCSLIHVCSYLQ